MILLYLFCGDFSGSFLVNFASLPMPNNIGVFPGRWFALWRKVLVKCQTYTGNR